MSDETRQDEPHTCRECGTVLRRWARGHGGLWLEHRASVGDRWTKEQNGVRLEVTLDDAMDEDGPAAWLATDGKQTLIGVQDTVRAAMHIAVITAEEWGR